VSTSLTAEGNTSSTFCAITPADEPLSLSFQSKVTPSSCDTNSNAPSTFWIFSFNFLSELPRVAYATISPAASI